MKKVLSVLAVLLIIVIGAGYFAGTKIYPIEFKEDIVKYSKEYGSDPYLVAAIINSETGFREFGYYKGEKSGVMQIREEAAERWAKEIGMKDFNVEQLGDSSTNIRLGAWYLGQLEKKNNDIDSILEGWADKSVEDGYTYEEGVKKNYTDGIKSQWKKYKMFHAGLDN